MMEYWRDVFQRVAKTLREFDWKGLFTVIFMVFLLVGSIVAGGLAGYSLELALVEMSLIDSVNALTVLGGFGGLAFWLLFFWIYIDWEDWKRRRKK